MAGEMILLSMRMDIESSIQLIGSITMNGGQKIYKAGECPLGYTIIHYG